MPTGLNTCTICGASFPSGRPGETDCGDQRKHDQIKSGQSRRKDDKKDGGKK
jgi:hypothetical protein